MPRVESQVRDNRLCKMAARFVRIFRYLENPQINSWSGSTIMARVSA